MKSIIATAIAAVALAGASAAAAAERTATLSVKNMGCVTCEPVVRKSLERVEGVKRVEVSADTGTAVVVYEDTQTSVDKLVAATTNAGYPSSLKK